MPINISVPDLAELKPRITVFGVGGGGCNAVNNMISSNLTGVEFVVANTDAQALMKSPCERRIQMGVSLTQGLGAGSQPEVGAAAAEEALSEILDHLAGSHMVFITAGMGGGTGTGAAPVIARAAREQGILTVGVVTKPFNFEGRRRMAIAERGIDNLAQHVDTLIVIPNQNLFRVANEATSFTAAFAMADQVLYSGVASITELMTKEGLINLDFADVRAVMSDMGKAMMGTGEASGEERAQEAALAAIANPLLDIESMAGARGVLISIAGGPDLTLYEVDQAASRIREEVDPEANIIVGATIEEELEGTMRVSVVATGLQDEALAATQDDSGKERSRIPLETDSSLAEAGMGTMMPSVGTPPRQQEGTMDAQARDASRAERETRREATAPSTEEMLPFRDDDAGPTVEGSVEPPTAPELKIQPLDEELAGADGEAEPDAGAGHRPHQPAPCAPRASAESDAGQVRIPGVEELPAPLREVVRGKQERVNKVAGGFKDRSGMMTRVKSLFGIGQEAPQPPRQQAPQPQPRAATRRVATASSPVEKNDEYDIPAFLRRS